MKKILFALLLTPSLAFSSELATYSITMSIDGMLLPGLPPGTGDRSNTFQISFPSDSKEAADKLWYLHWEALLGNEDLETLRAKAQEFGPPRRK